MEKFLCLMFIIGVTNYYADLDGDRKKEQIEISQKTLIIRDDNGKIILMEEINTDFTNCRWQTLKWPSLDIVLIKKIQENNLLSGFYLIYWGPKEKPVVGEYKLSHFTNSRLSLQDLDDDGREEIIISCDVLLTPLEWLCNVLGSKLEDIERLLPEEEKQKFPYVLDFTLPEFNPLVWGYKEMSQNKEILNQWIKGIIKIIQVLQEKGDYKNRRKAQEIVDNLIKYASFPVIKTSEFEVNFSDREEFQCVCQIKGCGLFDEFVTFTPLMLHIPLGEYEGQFIVVKGGSLEAVGLLDELNYFKWKAGRECETLYDFGPAVSHEFTFKISENKKVYVILVNTKNESRKIFLRFRKKQ